MLVCVKIRIHTLHQKMKTIHVNIHHSHKHIHVSTHTRTKPKVKNNTIESEPFQYTTTIHTICLLFLLPCFLCYSLRCSERSFCFSLTLRLPVSYAIVFPSLFCCLSFASVHTVLPLSSFVRCKRVLVFKFCFHFFHAHAETQFHAKSEMYVAYTESTCFSFCLSTTLIVVVAVVEAVARM